MMKYLRSLPEQVKSTIIITLVLCIVAIIIGKKVKKINPTNKIPLWLMPVVMIVDIINNFIKVNIGRRWKTYAPYFLALAIFIFFSNISAVFFMSSPTSYIMVNAALAIITFFIVQITGIISNGIIGYLKGFIGPVKAISPVMIPINIIGEVTLPLSLTLRLTGNIISGGVISLIITGLLGYMAIPIMPFINGIFDIAFGVIQTAVFVILSIVFTSMKIDDSEKIYI